VGGYMGDECCRVGLQIAASYHGNYIERYLAQGTGYTIYNAGAVGHISFGHLDVEMDETLVTGLNFADLLYDASSDTYGSANVQLTVPSGNTWGVPTNNLPNASHYTFYNQHPLPWGPFSFTATGYTNTNSFPVNYFANLSSTGVSYSNAVPTAQWVNQVMTGPLNLRLLPGETVTNNSIAAVVSRAGN
jgi:hypothetical protein